ncbi:MAG: pseudouridine synthase [Balneolaceae bacterium]
MISSTGLFQDKRQLSRNVRLVEPYPITHRFTVESEFAGKTLLELMCTKFPFRPEEEWKSRIDDGRVYREEETGSVLSSGEVVFHYNPKVVEPTVPDEVEVLVETGEYLVVFKPAPLPMHPGGRYNKNTLTEILKDSGYPNLRITHRLDAVTSGIVLFAKTKEFAKKATECFTKGKVQKTYFAKVSGTPKEESITIDSPVKRKHGFVFESKKGLDNAKEAITHFEVVERKIDFSIIKCIPETGRTHQIRLHLAEWGYPIFDDPIYGEGGDVSSRSTQNRSISLVSSGLVIEELEIDYQLVI